MERKLISKKELKSVYGIPQCFAHIARLEAAGQFPKRVVLGACQVAWVAEEVEARIEERVANRALTFPPSKGRSPAVQRRGSSFEQRSGREAELAIRTDSFPLSWYSYSRILDSKQVLRSSGPLEIAAPRPIWVPTNACVLLNVSSTFPHAGTT